MSQRNDENAGLAIALAVVGLVMLAFVAMVVAAIVLICFGYTIHCLFAWKKPVTFWDSTIFPDEAQAFVYRGMAGGVIGFVIALIIMASNDLERPERGAVILSCMIAGYVIGSLGIEVMKSGKTADGSPDIFPERRIPAPSYKQGPIIDIEKVPNPAPAAAPEPFGFAEWDDGEAKS